LRSSSASAPPRVQRHPAAPGREGAGRLLGLLKGAGEGYVSGSRLAAALGVSRTAVWKQVRSLGEEGYSIDAVPHRGYRLAALPEHPVPREVAAGLATRWLGSLLIAYGEVDSTNRVAMQDPSLPHGAVVYAFRQSGGRGRLGRAWLTPAGSIPFSMVLTPALAPQRAQALTVAAAVGLARGVEAACGVRLDIKWPNDLQWAGRKVAGILTELRSDPDRILRAVVGVGLNVNTAADAFPPAVAGGAASVAQAAGGPVDPAGLLRAVLAALEGAFDAALAEDPGRFAALLDTYRDRCVTLGRAVTVTERNGAVLHGTATGVDDLGALWVRGPDGRTRPVYAGDVTLSGTLPAAGAP
jgi:BirA family biotin operon repressor/biotin-[acetyl-CoA-carboxylase] ligase